MIKVKTFDIKDESINDFIEEVAVINDGIKVASDTIVVVYRDSKYLEFGEEEKKAVLSNKLYQEGQALLDAELNLKYFDLFPLDENTGVRRRSIEEKIDKNKGMIELLKEELK